MTLFARTSGYSFRLFLITLIMLLACITSSRAESVDEQTGPRSIVAVIHCEYGPVSFWDKTTNAPAGFFVDIMEKVSARAGLQVSYLCKNGWDEMIIAIERGEADLGALMKSKEREQKLLFSTPIDTSYLSFFTRSQIDADPESVPSGHMVGVIKGSMSHEQMKNRSDVRLQIYGSYREGLFGLLAGEISLFAGEESMVLKQIQETRLEDRIKKVGKPFVERQRCLVVRKDDVQLHALMNETLRGFVGGPEYQQIYLAWYGAPAPYWTNRRILVGGGGFLLFAVSGMALWRYASISRINAELIRTIAERGKAEANLAERNQFIESIINLSPDILYVYDIVDKRNVYSNDGIQAILGYSAQEAGDMGSQLLPLLMHPDDFQTYLQDTMPKYARAQDSEQIIHQYRMRHKNGEWRWLYCHELIYLRDAAGAPRQIFGMAHDITESKRAEDQILRSLKEKEVLLKEIHHRVKNNMQVIYSLLNLQARTTVDRTARSILEESRDRVNSMALVHEKLYQSKDLAHIDFKEYLQSLVSSIASTHQRDDVVFSVDTASIALDVNVGIPCGLIVNELVSNSLKYAFPGGRKGTIRVGISENNEGNYVLTIADNGIGFPEEVDFRNTSSLGLQLVNVLTGQIRGSIELSRSGGTGFVIRFPGNSANKGEHHG